MELAFLSALDINIVPETTAKNDESALKAYNRDGVQLIINALFGLESTATDGHVFAKLPPRIHNSLPRAKPCPKARASTRWEKFAAVKGIQKRKKGRVAFDESTQEYRPVFGYKNQGKQTADLSDWVKEVPIHSNQTDDQFEVARAEKKKNVEKNAMQHRRNYEEAAAAISGTSHKKMKLQKMILDTKVSTASMGKFDAKLDHDNVKVKGTKRKVHLILTKFDSMTKPEGAEKAQLMQIAANVGKSVKAPVAINTHKAIQHVRESTGEKLETGLKSRGSSRTRGSGTRGRDISKASRGRGSSSRGSSRGGRGSSRGASSSRGGSSRGGSSSRGGRGGSRGGRGRK